mgnify:FL=1|tara:strand:+ start:69 stop:740 length:672 start_codon:yes stop_codon:yes gene_type:complete
MVKSKSKIGHLFNLKPHELWEEKKDLLKQINNLNNEIREPSHSHEFYDDISNKIVLLEEESQVITEILNKKEWYRDLHRLITEFKSFAKGDKHLIRIVDVLINRLGYENQRKIIQIWNEKIRKEKQKRKKLQTTQNLRNAYPQFDSCSVDELWIKVAELKRLKKKERQERKKVKQQILNQTTNGIEKALLSRYPLEDLTEEKIQYYRNKYGITKKSFEENKDE